jgi:Outer membrane protein beta-barrel domain
VDSIGDVDDFIKNRTGVQAGLVAEFRANNNFALQTGLDWVQRGYRFEFEEAFLGINNSIKSNTVVNYVDIPVLAKLGVGKGPVRVDLLVGPSIGYAVSGKDKSTYTFGGVTETEETKLFSEEDDTDEGYNRFELQAQAGAMLSVNFGSTSFFVDGRYLHGLTNLLDEEGTGDDDVRGRNRGAAFSAGLLFKL